MVWPDYIQSQFKSANECGGIIDESFYYGPYNSILNGLFPASEGFMISPKPLFPQRVLFNVTLNGHCVFLLQVKSSASIRSDLARANADGEIREQILDLKRDLQVPILHAISAFGTHLTFYRYEKTTNLATPVAISKNPNFITDVAPIERWKDDLMQPNGEQKLLIVADEVKVMCKKYLK